MVRLYVSEDGTPETGGHWHWNMDTHGKPRLQVDFHHTITKRCSACPGEDPGDTEANGEVQDGAVEWLTHLRETFWIVIVTGSGSFWDAEQCQTIVDYLDRNGVPYDEIRFDKEPAMYIIDDRSLFHTSWANTGAEILRRSVGIVEAS